MSDILGAAVGYALRGFSVIPVQPRDKRALIHWEQCQKERGTGEEINAWGSKWPDANIGVVTGAISGLVVIDVDSTEAKDKLKELVPVFDFSAVPRSRTGKGWQLFFKHPGVVVPNRAGVIPGLDVRGDGGYVVAPPSINPNAETFQSETGTGAFYQVFQWRMGERKQRAIFSPRREL